MSLWSLILRFDRHCGFVHLQAYNGIRKHLDQRVHIVGLASHLDRRSNKITRLWAHNSILFRKNFRKLGGLKLTARRQLF